MINSSQAERLQASLPRALERTTAKHAGQTMSRKPERLARMTTPKRIRLTASTHLSQPPKHKPTHRRTSCRLGSESKPSLLQLPPPTKPFRLSGRLSALLFALTPKKSTMKHTFTLPSLLNARPFGSRGTSMDCRHGKSLLQSRPLGKIS